MEFTAASNTFQNISLAFKNKILLLNALDSKGNKKNT